jgi:hypothetical protein
VICLTFDTDHVDEARMAEFLELAPIPGRATFFCTQRYACLDETGHELSGHPFLEPGGDWGAELRRMRELFPDATGWRSHSCVYSHMLGVLLAQDGYAYASTQTEIGRAGGRPYREAWGLWQLPIYYMDNSDFSTPRFWPGREHAPFSPLLIETATANDGVYVFDFHPVHLLLNSPSAEWYLSRREAFAAGDELAGLRFDGYGAFDFYEDLCAEMAAADLRSRTLADAVAAEAVAPVAQRR